MTELYDIYVCPICGNKVEVVHPGGGELVCCGHPMQHAVVGMADASAEKHVPVIEKMHGGYYVKVGSVGHPSTMEHYIEWIELICPKTGKLQRKHLNPGDSPEAVFQTASDEIIARAYCNLHGLWQAKK